MSLSHPRRAGAARRSRSHPRKRVLLVGLTALTMEALEGPLSDVADVSAVPFPGDAFDRAADEFGPDLVIVDVTYLDEPVVRPLITHRLVHAKPLVVYLSERGQGWYDDLGAVASGPFPDASVAGLVRLVSGPSLRLVGGSP